MGMLLLGETMVRKDNHEMQYTRTGETDVWSSHVHLRRRLEPGLNQNNKAEFESRWNNNAGIFTPNMSHTREGLLRCTLDETDTPQDCKHNIVLHGTRIHYDACHLTRTPEDSVSDWSIEVHQ